MLSVGTVSSQTPSGSSLPPESRPCAGDLPAVLKAGGGLSVPSPLPLTDVGALRDSCNAVSVFTDAFREPVASRITTSEQPRALFYSVTQKVLFLSCMNLYPEVLFYFDTIYAFEYNHWRLLFQSAAPGAMGRG